MADIVSREARSLMMSGIRGSNTKPEIRVRSLLHRNGFRFRLGTRGLTGRPDVVLPKWRTVVFVHGCFWHRHRGCKYSYTPKSNVPFWNTKFEANIARDKLVARKLRAEGWRVVVIWECQVSERKVAQVTRTIRRESR
jgi:DNA mismatch endonuclease (patch repair protein)